MWVSYLSICLSVSWDLLEPLTAPSGPFTTRTTAAFTLHSFFSSSLRLWYFSSFPCSIFLVLLGTWSVLQSANVVFQNKNPQRPQPWIPRASVIKNSTVPNVAVTRADTLTADDTFFWQWKLKAGKNYAKQTHHVSPSDLWLQGQQHIRCVNDVFSTHMLHKVNCSSCRD